MLGSCRWFFKTFVLGLRVKRKFPFVEILVFSFVLLQIVWDIHKLEQWSPILSSYDWYGSRFPQKVREDSNKRFLVSNSWKNVFLSNFKTFLDYCRRCAGTSVFVESILKSERALLFFIPKSIDRKLWVSA